MKLRIFHTTTYAYDQPVPYALQQIKLTPKNRQYVNVIDWQISAERGKIELEFDDHNNNRVVLASCDLNDDKVVISASGTVETRDNSGIMGTHGGFMPLWYFKRSTNLTNPGKSIRQLAKEVEKKSDDSLETLHALSSLIQKKVQYRIGDTHTQTTAEDATIAGAGVCQDHAHVFLSAARLMGFPARYVSGYLMLDDRIEQDATHAWAEAHISGLGWVGFDVSNGISPDERYVPVATGLDYLEAAPISGMRFGDSNETMIVSLQVQQ